MDQLDAAGIKSAKDWLWHGDRARGGMVLGVVDSILDLHRFGRLQSDGHVKGTFINSLK